QVAVAERRQTEDLPEAERSAGLRMVGHLKPHMLARIADDEDRKRKAQQRVAHPQIERVGPQAIALRNVPREKSRNADRQIAGELIESDSQSARPRADEINLHD